jgi:hypothetical protein
LRFPAAFFRPAIAVPAGASGSAGHRLALLAHFALQRAADRREPRCIALRFRSQVGKDLTTWIRRPSLGSSNFFGTTSPPVGMS